MTTMPFKVPLPHAPSDRLSIRCSKCKLTKAIDKSEADTRSWFKKWHFKICDGKPELVEPVNKDALIVPKWMVDEAEKRAREDVQTLTDLVTNTVTFPLNRRLRQGEVPS